MQILDPQGRNMKQVTEKFIQKMVDIIVNEADSEKVILFGAHARGDARPDSDMDFIVIESELFGENRGRGAETMRMWRALSGLGVSKDILVYSNDEWEYWHDCINHVLGRAFQEGKVLYEKS